MHTIQGVQKVMSTQTNSFIRCTCISDQSYTFCAIVIPINNCVHYVRGQWQPMQSWHHCTTIPPIPDHAGCGQELQSINFWKHHVGCPVLGHMQRGKEISMKKWHNSHTHGGSSTQAQPNTVLHAPHVITRQIPSCMKLQSAPTTELMQCSDKAKTVSHESRWFPVHSSAQPSANMSVIMLAYLIIVTNTGIKYAKLSGHFKTWIKAR